jgi:hypothetical protein
MPIEPRELEREGAGLEEGETREETKLREFMVLSSPVEPSRMAGRRGRGREGAWWVGMERGGGTESRKSLVPLLWGTTGPADADWDGASTAVSVCTV